ncbi:tetratricopeptide repeat protein [Gloeobacter morelensis]|uniref:Tetratricopeptide repeat protein n=1 Tax=Gloeobacter morelensis MG652769 TaxID=2781736 RepID=A0ABY3PGV1_9CYAN|nr:tetratricopeptide repeat protein [Gloeobacter morelensis]UFP92869.1 tetratricopeptide repeat protein [Gloeobacter morelensis MG652769]
MKHGWLLSAGLASLVWIGGPAGPAGSQTNLQQLFKDAYAQQNKGNYTKALKIWNEVLQRSPDEPAAYVNRGITRYLMRDLRGAADDFGLAIDRKADYANAYFNRAVVYNDLKEFNRAVDDYGRYLELAPNAPDAPQARAMLDAARRRAAAPSTATRKQATASPSAPPQPADPTSRPPAGPATLASTGDQAEATSSPRPVRPPVAASPPAPVDEPAAAPPATAMPLVSASRPTELPAVAPSPSPPVAARPGAVAVGKISGYDATTDDVLLGLRLSVERKVLSREAAIYGQTQNFVVRMERGSTVDEALESTGLDRQALIRLAWRGAAWRTYKIYIK